MALARTGAPPRAIARCECGNAIPPFRSRTHPGPTFRDCTAAWLATQSLHVRPQTADLYEYRLGRDVLPVIGDRPITDLTAEDLTALLAGLMRRGTAPGTVRLVHVLLTAVFRDALGRGTIMEDVRRPKHRKVKIQPVYDERQLQRFLDASTRVTPHLTPLFLLCGRLGLRIGEALALRMSDLDFDARKIRIERTCLESHGGPRFVAEGSRIGPTKSGQVRVVDMTTSVVEALQPIAAERLDGFVFPGRNSRGAAPRNYTTVFRGMKKAAALAGLPYCSPHMLRHAAASILIARGTPVDYVSRMLGHTRFSQTMNCYGRHVPFARPPIMDEL